MGWLIGGIILTLLFLKLTGRLPGGGEEQEETRPDLEGDMLYGGGEVQADASEPARPGSEERPDLQGDMLHGGGEVVADKAEPAPHGEQPRPDLQSDMLYGEEKNDKQG